MSRTAFDGAASTYDQEFETSPATARIRAIVHAILLEGLLPGNHLLEINCGTGTDAIALAKQGISIFATDEAPGMIAETREKVEVHQLQSQVTAQVLAFDELQQLKGECFDAVLSNMGGLNCTGNLPQVARDLSSLVRNGGSVVLCLMSPFCLWETGAFLLRGNVKEAFRRSRGRARTVLVRKAPVKVYYYSPSDVKKGFFPWFRHKRTLGLNVFSPPPSSRQAYSFLGKSHRFLEWMDDFVGETYPFSHIGDHFVMVLERTHIAAP